MTPTDYPFLAAAAAVALSFLPWGNWFASAKKRWLSEEKKAVADASDVAVKLIGIIEDLEDVQALTKCPHQAEAIKILKSNVYVTNEQLN